MTVAADRTGFYHCISRCVRRAWLCGRDPLSGRDFDHRRDWIEQRLIQLADSFAVGLYAWAVMSNHTHVVLRVDPGLPWTWTDEEVAERWARLSRTLDAAPQPHEVAGRVHTLLQHPKRLEELRCRLGSVSWFMRFLNEAIARQANAEDGCTGRFWEGRFKCQALLDETAVLACMAYVDLNPIRAGICDSLMDSEFTSIRRRLLALGEGGADGSEPLAALHGVDEGENRPQIDVATYIELVDASGRVDRPDKRGRIGGADTEPLARMGGRSRWWSACVNGIERVFGTAVGLPESLRQHAAETGRNWMPGSSLPSPE